MTKSAKVIVLGFIGIFFIMVTTVIYPVQSSQPAPTPSAVAEVPDYEHDLTETVPNPIVIIRREHASDVEPVAIGNFVDGIVQVELNLQSDAESIQLVEVPIFRNSRIAGIDADTVTVEVSFAERGVIQLLQEADLTFSLFPSDTDLEDRLYYNTDCEQAVMDLTEQWDWIDSPRVVSPDGQWIAYTINNPTEGAQVFVESIHTGDVELLDSFQTGSAGTPSWSPDSSQIAYTRKGLSQPVNWHLIVINRDGTNRYEVSELHGYYDHIAWSPNGRHLAYASGGTIGSGSSGYTYLDIEIYVVEAMENIEPILVTEGCDPNWSVETPNFVSLGSYIQPTQTCEITVGGYGSHDMLQIFETPRFDLHNPIGELVRSRSCAHNCSPLLLSVLVRGIMITPDSLCMEDRDTCGLWYLVSSNIQDEDIRGWISGQDEDLRLLGDCSNLSALNPYTTFASIEDPAVDMFSDYDFDQVIHQSGFTADNTHFVLRYSYASTEHSLTAPEYIQVWNVESNTLSHTIEVGRASIISQDLEYVMSVNHIAEDILQPPRLIQIRTGRVIAEAPQQRNVSHVSMNNDATSMIVAFHQLGYPPDEIWLWTEETGWVLVAVPTVTSNNEWSPYEQSLNGTIMVLVPPGEFLMGSTPEEIETAHTLLSEGLVDVNIDALTFFDGELVSEANRHWIPYAYWIDKFEVTNAQFRQCVLAGECISEDVYPPDDIYPMRLVSLAKARDYCSWRGGQVPTEVEWEYAARGPDRLIFPWGNIFDPAIVNIDPNTHSVGEANDVIPVNSHPDAASWVGAYNMAGNVAEWTRSQWALYPYDSNDGRESNLETLDTYYIYRGGSFRSSSAHLRTAWRGTTRDFQQGNEAIGFRCVYPFQ